MAADFAVFRAAELGFGRPITNTRATEQPRSTRLSLRSPAFRLKSCAPMYIPTKTPRKLDRKRSKRLRSKTAAKNRGRREQLKK
jgi:hypothetical protein